MEEQKNREPKLIINVGARGCGRPISKQNQVIIDDVK